MTEVHFTMNFSLVAVILNSAFSICSAMPNMSTVRGFNLKNPYIFSKSDVLGSDDIESNWMYKRGASASGIIGNAKMVGNNGLGLQTFGDSFLKFLKTLGL